MIKTFIDYVAYSQCVYYCEKIGKPYVKKYLKVSISFYNVVFTQFVAQSFDLSRMETKIWLQGYSS